MPNNLDAFIPEVWSTRVIENIDQRNLALMIMTNSDYEGDVRQFGDTVYARTYGNVTTRPYSRGQGTVSESLTPTKEPMYIDQADYFQIELDDLDAAQNDLQALTGYTRRAGVSMANVLDTFCFSFYSSALSANILNSGSAINIVATSAGSTHVYDILVEAGRLLDVQNVDERSRWVVVTPYFKSLLLKDTVYFINGSTLGDTLLNTATVGMDQTPMSAREALSRGFIGQAAGFDIYCSNNLPAITGGYACPYGQGKPLSFAAQLQPGSVEALRSTTTFATLVRGLMLYGGKVFTEPSKRLGYIPVDNS